MQAILVAFLAVIAGAFAFSPLRTSRVISGSQLSGVKLIISDEEPIENTLRRFKRAVNQSGHLMDLRFKEQWETAADKRKRKHERARQLNRIERTNDKYERRADGASEYNT